MENFLCPLCGERTGEKEEHRDNISDIIDNASPGSHNHNYISKDHSFLKHVINKHLHIKLIENDVNKLCHICKKTIIDWDQFAEKCWKTRGYLDENVKIDEDINYLELKIENPLDENEDDDDNDNDAYPLIHYDIKTDDPLNSKTKTSSKKTDKSSKLKRKGLHKKRETKDDTEVKKESSKKKTAYIDFSCNICSAKVNTWTYLVRHFTKDHPTAKPKALCMCGKYLSSKSAIISHNNRHDEKKAHKCETCGKIFGDNNIFKEHMLIHFPDKDFRYTCPHCQKNFFQHSVYQYHVKTHLPSELKHTFTCDICGDKFGTKLGMQTHKLARHENVRNHVCDQCGLSFVTKNYLKGHQKTVHNELRLYECDQCPKKFKLHKHLKRHREDVHFPKELKCPLCPTVLKNMSTFRKHKNIHNSDGIPV